MTSMTIPHSNTPRNDLTAAYVREALEYDPVTGLFRWRDRPREHFATKRAFSSWNACFAGKGAGRQDDVGYRRISICGQVYKGHRIAWLYVTGRWPHAEIDHVNGVKDDNRFANLREATRHENNRNSKRPRNNTSGLKGVCWHKRDGKCRAQIRVSGRNLCLGNFTTPEEAHAAYVKASERLHGVFGRVA
jgi:hypothetical protein